MKRAGFTMIELIFVIVILGILAAVAVPKLSGIKDDAQLANANENFCIATKSSMLNRALRSDTLEGFDLNNSVTLPVNFSWDATDSGVLHAAGGGTLNARTTAANGWTPAISNATNSIYVFFVEGNSTAAPGCFIGSDATGSTRGAADALTRVANGQGNYL